MKAICLFAAYFTEEDIPYYITVYLKELKKQFGEVVLLCSQKKLSQPSLDFLKEEEISLNVSENKGFDFGLWYFAFQKYNLENYEQVALVNDSSILFKSLDAFMKWSKNDSADVKGITRSEAIYPHLQSYFLVLNKKAVNLTANYFKEHKVLHDISEVILKYEVGLSKYLQENGLTISAFMDNKGYTGEFSPYYYCIDYHLEKGVPMIKKKILFASYRKTELFTLARMNFNIDRNYYFDLLEKQKTQLIINLEKLKENKSQMTFVERVKYTATKKIIRLAKPLYNLLKRA